MFIFANENYFVMEKNLLLELLEDGDKVSLYSPRFEGEEFTEFEKFLLKYKDSYPDDIAQLVYRLDIVKRDGADDRHFRYEGTKEDENLNRCVQTLQKIDIELKMLEKKKIVYVTGTQLLGTLSFVIDV
jgi:hypothetical protein